MKEAKHEQNGIFRYLQKRKRQQDHTPGILTAGMENLTLLNDTFMMVALKDIAACQHVIRILMDDPTIEIVEVRTQYRVSRLVSKDSILDILAEDSRGRIYNLENSAEERHRPCPAYPSVRGDGGQ